MPALDSLLGNDTCKQALLSALESGRLAHSILLCGEPGTGAGFAARCLAADYLYPAGGAGAHQVLEGTSPEVIVLEGEGASGEIRVERVREVRREIFNTALSAHGRAVLIRHAEKLNGASANALLKVLEEPPEGVLFILTAPGEANILPTIRSRCCTYTLAPVQQHLCAETLRRLCPAGKEPERMAAIFGGRIGSALECMKNPAKLQGLRDALELCADVQKKDTYHALVILARYEKERAQAASFLALLRTLCAAALLGETAARVPLQPAAAARCAESAGRSIRLLEANISTKLVLTQLACTVTQ